MQSGGYILVSYRQSPHQCDNKIGPNSTQLQLDIVDQIWEQFKKVLILEHLEKVQGGLPLLAGLVNLKLRHLAMARPKNKECNVSSHGGKLFE